MSGTYAKDRLEGSMCPRDPNHQLLTVSEAEQSCPSPDSRMGRARREMRILSRRGESLLISSGSRRQRELLACHRRYSGSPLCNRPNDLATFRHLRRIGELAAQSIFLPTNCQLGSRAWASSPRLPLVYHASAAGQRSPSAFPADSNRRRRSAERTPRRGRVKGLWLDVVAGSASHPAISLPIGPHANACIVRASLVSDVR
jgi:hypothetical protein